jgi:glycosyltransferase involved in cell wall biosynthesis
VLAVSYLDYPSHFGLSRRIAGLSGVLKRNSIDVEILCPRYRALDVREDQENVVSFDLRILRGANPERAFSKLVCLLLFTIFAAKHIIRNRRKWNVIQYESVYSLLPAIAARILTNALIIGDDIIVHERVGGWLLDALTWPLEIIPALFSDVLITSSPASLRSLKRFAPGRHMYVPNGVDVPVNVEPRERVESPGKCVALFVGAPSYAENRAAIEHLVRLPGEMHGYEDRFTIWIVGGPLIEMKGILDQESVRTGVVKLWGTVNDTTLNGIYRSAKVALLPFFEAAHESGGQRVKALESFVHGLVVISTEAGIRGLGGLGDGVHFIRVATIKEMAETFKKIIDNPREYSEIAERGRIRIAGSFSWNTISRDYVKLVKRALVNRGASR